MNKWITLSLLQIFAAAIFISPAQAGGVFDPDRCGIQYPKLPESSATIPTETFRMTDQFGISSDYLPLACRAGSNLVLEQDFYFPNNVGAQMGLEHVISFKKAAIAAGTNGASLKNGECAFFNRPMSAGEPTKLRDSTIYSTPKMKLTTKVSSTGVTSKELTVAPAEYETLLRAGSVVVFYISPLTGASTPFCQRLSNGNILARPYLVIR